MSFSILISIIFLACYQVHFASFEKSHILKTSFDFKSMSSSIRIYLVIPHTYLKRIALTSKYVFFHSHLLGYKMRLSFMNHNWLL